MSDIYDGVWRTAVNDCKQLLLPYINEAFHEHYDGTETIIFHPNEHFLNQQDNPDVRRITDTYFSVIGKKKKKYHLECESSKYSERILIRLFEYDAQIALDDATIENNNIQVVFPNTSVLFLRDTKNTPDELKVSVIVPDGSICYKIPTIRLQQYSINDIFEKQLYILIPFYIFKYEKDFIKYNSNRELLKQLLSDFQSIINRLNNLTDNGILSAFDKRVIIELTEDVMNALTKNYDSIKKEVGDIVRGPMIETEAKKLLDEGISQGITQGMTQGRQEAFIDMVKDGLISIADAAKKLNMSENEFKKLV